MVSNLPDSTSQAYFLQFGTFPDLSWAEVASILPIDQLERVANLGVIARVELDPEQLIDRCGGLVKIAKIEDIISQKTPADIEKWLVAYLTKNGPTSFGVGELGRDQHPKLKLQGIKNQLPEKQRYRFIESVRYGISAAILLHHPQTTEVLFVQNNEEVICAKTVAVQNIDYWTNKDRSKPYADRKRGMLAPKLAKIMLNLALGDDNFSAEDYVYDPFAGSGTVSIEALDLGLSTIASDLDKEAVDGTQANLDWFSDQRQAPGKFHVFQADATHLDPKMFPVAPKYVVSEPFLGKQTPSADFLPNMFKGLEKLYLGFFKDLTKVLPSEATIVFVTPAATDRAKQYNLSAFIDKLQQFGYTTDLGPLEYQRPNAVVRRHIWRLKFKKQHVTR